MQLGVFCQQYLDNPSALEDGVSLYLSRKEVVEAHESLIDKTDKNVHILPIGMLL